MRRLLLLIYGSRKFLLFLVLEVMCAFLVIRNNRYKNATWFNSSNSIAASIYEKKVAVTKYFSLAAKNQQTKEEMADLLDRYALLVEQNKQLKQAETALDIQYRFVPARVINNSIYSENNYLTINKGTNDGLKTGMGVICSNGIVGKIKGCSANFATVQSFLHSNTKVSSKLKKNNVLCTSNWNGESFTQGNIHFIPRHVKLSIGDTVVTSGFNAVYPEGVVIGTINNKELENHHSFHNATMKLTTDFSSLNFVFVVDNKSKDEQIQLEESTNDE